MDAGGRSMTKKHLPTRTCIACRRIKPKQNMIRIVRRPDGVVEVDESGKANGRGGYLCQHFNCWRYALKKRATLLKRTLRVDFDRDTYMILKKFAMQYKPPKEEQAEEATNAENKASGEGTPDAEAQTARASESETTAEKPAPENTIEKKKEESS